MITNNSNNPSVPEKFLLFFDCNSQGDIDDVKYAIERTNTPGDRLYNTGIDKFKEVQNAGVFGEKMYARGTSIYGTRYGYNESYEDDWMMRCADYSILVYSNCGDLVIDLAQEIGHPMNIQRDNTKYAKIIAAAIKDYRENGGPINIAIELDELYL